MLLVNAVPSPSPRHRYIGTRPVRLFRVLMNRSESVLAVSSRSWLSYIHQSRLHLTPLSYEVLDYVSSFSSEQCPEGIVAIATNTLRILSLEKLGIIFNQVATPLQYTPRKLELHPPTGNLVLVETDHRAFTEASKSQRKQQMAEEMVGTAGEEEQEAAAEAAESFLSEELPEAVFGAAKAGPGMWASCLRIMHPTEVSNLAQPPSLPHTHKPPSNISPTHITHTHTHSFHLHIILIFLFPP